MSFCLGAEESDRRSRSPILYPAISRRSKPQQNCCPTLLYIFVKLAQRQFKYRINQALNRSIGLVLLMKKTAPYRIPLRKRNLP